MIIFLIFLTKCFQVPGDGSSDYLEIRSGDAKTGPLLGRYSDSNKPETHFRTRRSSLWIKYARGSSPTSPATFSASWVASAGR